METTGYRGLACVDCDETVDLAAETRRCPTCSGQLEPRYDLDAVDPEAVRSAWPATDQWAFEALLPHARADAVSMGEGATPLVDCPPVAEELGVERVLVKDEGQNPTGTVADRELATAVTAAAQREVSDVALPSTGGDAVAAAAYGARAGIDVHAFVPTRSTHDAKALINVHDGDMTVVEGRLPDAEDAYDSAIDDAEDEWTPLAPGAAPLRVAGASTLLLEVFAELEWSAPDAVVYPTGLGVGVSGGDLAIRQCAELGLCEESPALYAAQAEGCAPIVEASDAGTAGVSEWKRPDTIAGALEVPAPALGDRALAALDATGGGGVAVEDEAILESACSIAASSGVEASVAGGAAAAGALQLAESGVLAGDDTVVLVNTGAGSLDADVLRSHLMRKGI